MPRDPLRRAWIAALAAAALGCPFKSVSVDSPRAGLLIDDPAPLVSMSGRVGKNFSLASIAVALDGVDLLAALALTPPFTGAGGVVALPSGSVTVSAFTVQNAGSHYGVALSVSGLATGGHELEISAERSADLVTVADASDFSLVTPLSLAADGIPAAARAAPGSLAGGGRLAHDAGGEAAAGGAASAVAQVRAGFTPVAEAHIAGAP